MILPDTSLENAAVIAEKIRTCVAAIELFEEGEKIPMTISLGVATSEADMFFDQEQLIRAADAALYNAKLDGRNCVHIFQSTPDFSLANAPLLSQRFYPESFGLSYH